MDESAITEPTQDAVERALREDLVRADRAIASVRPVLRHVLAHDDPALFNDEVIARVRGMMRDLARQLLQTQAASGGERDVPAFVGERFDALVMKLSDDTELLAHAHALALEARLLDALRLRTGVEPVLPPLIVELAAGTDADLAELAMHALAAQARFVQQQHRMALPLAELPAELFHAATAAQDDDDAARLLRQDYAEGHGRQALLTRLAIAIGHTPDRALSVEHAGLSVLASALALAADQPRDAIIVSLAIRHSSRLALTLRAVGLAPAAIDRQLAALQAVPELPAAVGQIATERAAALLTSALLEPAT
ncbi:MAG: hypothetical protein ABIT09_09735 [Croceibacterium sp.]